MESNKPIKAYKNLNFLNSRAARNIRILCEHEETEERLKRLNVGANIMIFGSARSLSEEKWALKKVELEEKISAATEEKVKEDLNVQLVRHQKLYWMVQYHDKTEELGRLLTEWSLAPENRETVRALVESVDPDNLINCDFENENESPLLVCTGGGPGLMEAANKGAASVSGGRSMGMGVSLPFENKLNQYITPDLSFEFHYFFTRKFWMVYYTCGIIATPGGVGTLDELFEVMTLKQTGKITRDIPIVLFGEEYWRKLIDFDLMVECGVVAAKDRDQVFYTDDPKVAVEYIVSHLKKEAENMIMKKAELEGENKKACYNSCI